MKGSFQRFCWRMEQNKDPPIVEGPRGRGVEVVQWAGAWGVHSSVLAWIQRLFCCSWARAGLCCVCLWPKPALFLSNSFPSKPQVAPPQKVSAVQNLCCQDTQTFPQKNPNYLSACAQFSGGELVPAALGAGTGLQRGDPPPPALPQSLSNDSLAPGCRATNFSESLYC